MSEMLLPMRWQRSPNGFPKAVTVHLCVVAKAVTKRCRTKTTRIIKALEHWGTSSLFFPAIDDCVQAMLQMALPCRIRIWPINVKRWKISVILLVSWMCSWKWPSMIFRIPAVKTPPHFSSALQTARASFRASFSARLGSWTALTHDFSKEITIFIGGIWWYKPSKMAWFIIVLPTLMEVSFQLRSFMTTFMSASWVFP